MEVRSDEMEEQYPFLKGRGTCERDVHGDKTRAMRKKKEKPVNGSNWIGFGS